jgi:hypothetical protein
MQLLRTWASRGIDGQLRVVLINDSLRAPARALVRPPAGFGGEPGALVRLLAPSAYAVGRVTLGGSSFGGSTASGVLPPAAPPSVAPGAGGYAVSLPPGSAALLTLRGRAGAS